MNTRFGIRGLSVRRILSALSIITGLNILDHTPKSCRQKSCSLSVGFLFQEEGAPLPAQILALQVMRKVR